MPTIRGSEQHKQNLASAKKGKGKKSGVAAVQAICNRGKLPDLFGFGGGARRKDTKGKVKSSKPTEVEKPMDFNDYVSESEAGLATNLIFFCFLFCKKLLICLEGKSMTPHRGNTIIFRSSQQLPRHRLGHLEGIIELT